MALKEFDYQLNDHGDFLRIRIRTDRGEPVDFVVQYEPLIDGAYRPAVRFDGSHGRPHRDLLDWDGEEIRKGWLPADESLGAALTEAIADIEEHWASYREAFLRRRP